MIDKYIIGFLTAIDNLCESIAKMLEPKPKKKRKKKCVKIVTVSVIVKIHFTCTAINKICVFATTVNVNNYASIKTF